MLENREAGSRVWNMRMGYGTGSCHLDSSFTPPWCLLTLGPDLFHCLYVTYNFCVCKNFFLFCITVSSHVTLRFSDVAPASESCESHSTYMIREVQKGLKGRIAQSCCPERVSDEAAASFSNPVLNLHKRAAVSLRLFLRTWTCCSVSCQNPQDLKL